MKVLKAKDDTGCVEHGPGLREHVRVDMHHKIATSRVLHHEANMALIK